MLATLHNRIAVLHQLPNTLAIGMMILLAFYAGKSIRHIRLPNIIGFMITGIVLGPSLLNVIDPPLQGRLDFITEIALGAVALSIGLEMGFRSIRRKGSGILKLIVAQLLATLFFATGGIYLLTGSLALALPLGAIATTTGPAGTMAVIQDTKARGPLSETLYAVLGFDNALAIILFGFALSFSRTLIANSTGLQPGVPLWGNISAPFIEAALSLALGIAAGLLFCVMLRTQKDKKGVLIQTVAVLLVTIGICRVFGLSFIFALLVTGSVVVNTQPDTLLQRLRSELTGFMPLLYVLFFALAGASLHLSALPAVGAVGLVYVISRSVGKLAGAGWGAHWAGLEQPLKNYTGMALLSQAGVAIGLALIVQSELTPFGPEGERIGEIVLVTVTAACVVFELIGPMLTEKALDKAGEIQTTDTR